MFGAAILETGGAFHHAVALLQTGGILENIAGLAIAFTDEECMFGRSAPAGGLETTVASGACVSLLEAGVRNDRGCSGLRRTALFTFQERACGTELPTEIFEAAVARRRSVSLSQTPGLRRGNHIRATFRTLFESHGRHLSATDIFKTTVARCGSIALFRAHDGSRPRQCRFKLLSGGCEAESDEDAREEADHSLSVGVHISIHYSIAGLACRSRFGAAGSPS